MLACVGALHVCLLPVGMHRLGLELETVVSHHVGDGNQIWSSERTVSAAKYKGISLAPVWSFLMVSVCCLVPVI